VLGRNNVTKEGTEEKDSIRKSRLEWCSERGELGTGKEGD